MKLFLNNIGKLEPTAIEIDGITIIAGENNTGKSTVGKALFSFFNGFHDIQNQIEKSRISGVNDLLFRFVRKVLDLRGLDAVSRKIVNDRISDAAELRKLINAASLYNEYSLDEKTLDELTSRINEILDIEDSELLKSVLTNRINAEFNGQVANIFNDDDSRITLEIKSQTLSVTIKDQVVVAVDNPSGISLNTEAVYIDDPFVIDDIYRTRLYPNSGYEHKAWLCNKLRKYVSDENIVNEYITKKKLENVYCSISLAVDGELVHSNNSSGIGYRRKNDDKVLDIHNISTGMKTFAIIKMLLMNGTVEENGTIILDEPEIHLHPDWQLVLAETIVLLQNVFGLHILITTHSPYFLRAIQVYSAKHGIADRCRYYFSELNNDRKAVISDVSDDIEKIYAKLASSLQRLENERWSDD